MRQTTEWDYTIRPASYNLPCSSQTLFNTALQISDGSIEGAGPIQRYSWSLVVSGPKNSLGLL